MKIKKSHAAYKYKAQQLIGERVVYFSRLYGFRPNRITIRNQKTRWGSCSKKGNINFNYKIVFLPQRLADYVIVHELCHLKELNHSKNFWKLVGEILPNYKELRREMRGISLRQMSF